MNFFSPCKNCYEIKLSPSKCFVTKLGLGLSLFDPVWFSYGGRAEVLVCGLMVPGPNPGITRLPFRIKNINPD